MVSSINTSQKLVSIITPFLNGGALLREAIESVIAQTYSHWQLVLINDGSDDETSQLALEYVNRYSGKIICVEHERRINKGVTASRNLGIAHAKGEWVAFLDSDDCWLPVKLAEQLQVFEKYPDLGMLCEASTYWFSWEKPHQKDLLIKVGTEPGYYRPPELMYKLYPLGKGAAPCPSGMIMTRQALTRSNGFEESFTGSNQVYEDQAFLCKLYLFENVYVSDAANNLYRQRSGSLMGSIEQQNRYRSVRSFFIQWLENYLRERSINNARIKAMIRRAKAEIAYPTLFRILNRLGKLF